MTAAAKKWLKYGASVLLGLVVTLPFVPADLFRYRIQAALERGLGRRVEIGAVHFTLLPSVLPGPGFTVDQVLIHEDERAGIEPFAYVETLGASVRLLSLLRLRLEFGALDLGDATINIVKPASGPWNYQLLLDKAVSNTSSIPSIRMRGGRINFKFGDTKALFYLNNADINIDPSADGSFALRFAGAPSRTDRAARETGRLFVRGQSSASRQLNFAVELEKTELEDALRWVAPGVFGVHGTVTLQAQLSGVASQLAVNGNLEIGDIHRWDLLPAEASQWTLPFQGTLNLSGERLKLATPFDPAAQVAVRLEAMNWLNKPDWQAAADLKSVPSATALKIAGHMGAAVPELAASGDVSGALQYSLAGGLVGDLEWNHAALTRSAPAAVVNADAVAIHVANGSATLPKTLVRVEAQPEAQAAEIEAAYAFQPRRMDLRISTRGLDIALLRALGFTAVPVLKESGQGTWRGNARFAENAWSGDFELSDAVIPVDGLAQPLAVEAASVAMTQGRIRVTKLRAAAGPVPFTGEYRWEPDTPRPHRFTLSIADAKAVELRDLLAPTILRQTGFLSRTLRLSSPGQLPAWLESRHAEGSVAIGSLSLDDRKPLRNVSVKLEWDGPMVRLPQVKASLDPGTLTASASLDLSSRSPKLTAEGKLSDFGYAGGSVTLEGTAEAGGDVAEFLPTWQAQGTLRGRLIVFAPDLPFRTIGGKFETRGFGPQSQWKFWDLDVAHEGDTLTGTAATNPAGTLDLSLAGRKALIHRSVPFAP